MDKRIKQKIKTKLAEADKLKKRLDKFRPFDVTIEEYFRKYLDIILTYESNAMEGSTLSLNETKGILTRGRISMPATTREVFEVINHRDAIRYIETLTNKYLVTQKEILGVHKNILKHIRDDKAGKFRKEGVFILPSYGKFSIKYFSNWKQVPSLIKKLLQWLNDNAKKYHPILLAAELHYRFVMIHPFVDGNGRTARLLANLILLQHGYPYANITVKSKDRYLEAITTADSTKDMTAFYLIVIDAVIDMLKLYIKTYKERIIWK
jgi:Fic family protein